MAENWFTFLPLPGGLCFSSFLSSSGSVVASVHRMAEGHNVNSETGHKKLCGFCPVGWNTNSWRPEMPCKKSGKPEATMLKRPCGEIRGESERDRGLL